MYACKRTGDFRKNKKRKGRFKKYETKIKE